MKRGKRPGYCRNEAGCHCSAGQSTFRGVPGAETEDQKTLLVSATRTLPVKDDHADGSVRLDESAGPGDRQDVERDLDREPAHRESGREEGGDRPTRTSSSKH
jgi:hypothetical protein